MRRVPGSNPGESIIAYVDVFAVLFGSAHLCKLEVVSIRGSIVVSISACHADDPGSIPGRGSFIHHLCAGRAEGLLLAVNCAPFSGY